MVRRRGNTIVLRMKQCAQDGLLLFSDHARREMNDENFGEGDVSSVVLRGVLVARMTHGARGTRYVLRGRATDGREMEVVCRVTAGGTRIVTVYGVH